MVQLDQKSPFAGDRSDLEKAGPVVPNIIQPFFAIDSFPLLVCKFGRQGAIVVPFGQMA